MKLRNFLKFNFPAKVLGVKVLQEKVLKNIMAKRRRRRIGLNVEKKGSDRSFTYF